MFPSPAAGASAAGGGAAGRTGGDPLMKTLLRGGKAALTCINVGRPSQGLPGGAQCLCAADLAAGAAASSAWPPSVCAAWCRRST